MFCLVFITHEKGQFFVGKKKVWTLGFVFESERIWEFKIKPVSTHWHFFISSYPTRGTPFQLRPDCGGKRQQLRPEVPPKPESPLFFRHDERESLQRGGRVGHLLLQRQQQQPQRRPPPGQPAAAAGGAVSPGHAALSTHKPSQNQWSASGLCTIRIKVYLASADQFQSLRAGFSSVTCSLATRSW